MIITLIYQDNLHIVSGNNKINSKFFAFTLQMLQFTGTPQSKELLDILSKKKKKQKKKKENAIEKFLANNGN